MCCITQLKRHLLAQRARLLLLTLAAAREREHLGARQDLGVERLRRGDLDLARAQRRGRAVGARALLLGEPGDRQRTQGLLF